MNSPASPPRYISLNRLAKLSGRSRMTLLIRLKDGKLQADAVLDLGKGQDLSLFDPQKVALHRKPSASPHPLL
jgi:hypothetical protein